MIPQLKAPLDNPNYTPEHPPIDGRVPDVVAKWRAASQLRWFARFYNDLRPAPGSAWDRFYCSSALHTGSCCESCSEDQMNGYSDIYDGYCCCRSVRDTAAY